MIFGIHNRAVLPLLPSAGKLREHPDPVGPFFSWHLLPGNWPSLASLAVRQESDDCVQAPLGLVRQDRVAALLEDPQIGTRN